MTMQEAFDKAVLGLASQGFKRSVAADGISCSYNGVDGRHCAIGWLTTGIPMDNFNSKGIEDLVVRDGPCPEVAELIGHLSRRFLDDLQRAHDTAYDFTDAGNNGNFLRIDDPETMKRQLMGVAVDHGLSTTVLEMVG